MRKKNDGISKDRLALAGVAIAGAGLVWAIVSHFVPSPLPPPEPAPASASPSATLSINANGPGSIGYMSGGTVNDVLTPVNGKTSATTE